MNEPQNIQNVKITASELYWNKVGEAGYNSSVYKSKRVAARVSTHMGTLMLEASRSLGLGNQSKVLELGCGDGSFANDILAANFKSVDAYDMAPAAIERANKFKKENIRFHCADITQLEFENAQRWDAVFLVAILHHVKDATPTIISRLAKVAKYVIVMEPNGNNVVRKLLELLPSYQRAGEDSFRRKNLKKIFSDYGYEENFFRMFNLFPNLTPDSLYPLVTKIEPWVENSKFFNGLCTAQVFGFKNNL